MYRLHEIKAKIHRDGTKLKTSYADTWRGWIAFSCAGIAFPTKSLLSRRIFLFFKKVLSFHQDPDTHSTV